VLSRVARTQQRQFVGSIKTAVLTRVRAANTSTAGCAFHGMTSRRTGTLALFLPQDALELGTRQAMKGKLKWLTFWRTGIAFIYANDYASVECMRRAYRLLLQSLEKFYEPNRSKLFLGGLLYPTSSSHSLSSFEYML